MPIAKTSSNLPPEAAFLHAILRHLAARPDGDQRAAIHEAIPDLLQLSEAQRSERLPNLTHLRYRYRTGFGLSMLKAAGYIDSPSRGSLANHVARPGVARPASYLLR